MAARTGVIGIVFRILFAVPFVGIGLLSIAVGIHQLSFFSIVFGAIFGGAGAFQIVLALRARTSSESQARPQGGALASAVGTGAIGYRAPAGPLSSSARELYAPVLESAPLPRLALLPGKTFAFALGRTEPAQSYVGLVFGVVWLCLTTPFFLGMAAAHEFLPAAFLSIFVLVGLVIVFASLRKVVSQTKLPRVEVAAEPAFLGDTLDVFVEQRGPARVMRLRVDLLCRERARYTVGTDTRTEDYVAWSTELLDAEGEIIQRGKGWSHTLHVELPAGAPHSFAGTHNQIAWLLRVRGELAGFPDYDEHYEIRVLPRPAS